MQQVNTQKLVQFRGNMTQAQIAQKLGINQNTYSYKERGLKRISLKEAKVLADLFEVSIEDLFFN